MTTREEAMASIESAIHAQVNIVRDMPRNGVVLRESGQMIDSLARAYWALKPGITEPMSDSDSETPIPRDR